MKMSIKKGDSTKTIDIPVWGMFAMGVVVESIGRYVCKTVRSVTKTRHDVKEESEEQFYRRGFIKLDSLLFVYIS